MVSEGGKPGARLSQIPRLTDFPKTPVPSIYLSGGILGRHRTNKWKPQAGGVHRRSLLHNQKDNEDNN